MTSQMQRVVVRSTDRWKGFVTDVVNRATDGLCFVVDWFGWMDAETPAHLIVGTYESRQFDDELLGLAERLAGLCGEPIRISLMRTEWEVDVPVISMPSSSLPLARRFDDREDI